MRGSAFKIIAATPASQQKLYEDLIFAVLQYLVCQKLSKNPIQSGKYQRSICPVNGSANGVVLGIYESSVNQNYIGLAEKVDARILDYPTLKSCT
ncbi:hypothetical protein LC653_21890 [Nostoc sp. CHAB 5784]|nr:hypothetical protein [Nostoc mirabile CHAB5784]